MGPRSVPTELAKALDQLAHLADVSASACREPKLRHLQALSDLPLLDVK
jgi:hypothetical protein